MQNSNIYALLVGIDNYPAPVPKLEGCVNDIKAISSYLEERVDRQKYKLAVETLINEEATRQAIIDQFNQHLSQAQKDDVVLFYYSGHGSQEAAPPEFWHLEPDRLDETLVCWNSRTEDWDLADKELAYLIAKVAESDPHIVVVLDCCHAGSGTRDVTQNFKIRHTPADRRARTIADFIFSEEVKLQPEGEVTPPWNLRSGNHILLAACQDREVASEYGSNGEQRGAFSYFLLETLTKANNPLSYRELFKRTSALIRSRIKDQTPQLEATNLADLDNLPFLGEPDIIQPRAPFFTLRHDGKDWVIDGGAVHGIPQKRGAEIQLALFPQGSPNEQWQQLSETVGEAEIVKVLSDRSVVTLTRTPVGFDTDTVLNAVIISLPLPALGVYFEGDLPALTQVRQQLQVAGFNHSPSLYVREVEDLAEANYRLLARDGQYLITNPTDDRALVEQLEGYTDFNARKAIQILEHLARWTTTAELANPGSHLPTNAIKLQVYRGNQEVQEPTIRLTYEYRDGQWQPPTFRLKLTNTYHQRIYCAILDLPEDYAVSVPPLFAAGSLAYGGVWLEPGEEKWAGIWSGNQKIEDDIAAIIPEELLAQGITEYQDILKLIFSTTEFDATLLTQESLPPPKVELQRVGTRSLPGNSSLNQLMYRIQTRQFGAVAAPAIDAWQTSQLSMITVHPREMVTIQGDRATFLGSGVSIQSHAGLSGVKARLSTVAQATRDVGSHILPPILRDYTQPFHFTASRGVDPGLSALELTLTNLETLQSVTPEDPLILSVDKPLAEGEALLPIAYDGEFFIPLGRGSAKDGKTEIRLQRLVEPLAEKKRSLGGAIRIFFQKIAAEKLGLAFPYPILAAVDYGEDGSLRYQGDEDIIREKVTAANRIVLFIHGIIGDSQSIVPCGRNTKLILEGEEKSLAEIYDLVLTFDYENLNTPIPTIAEQLRDRTQAIGLGANHSKTLHIIAHSMGGLVARSFIEQKGGDRVVQHLIMLGTPNGGSPWSTVQDWAFTALTLGLNGLSVSGFPLAAVGNLLTAIEAIDINLDQMKPGSDFLTALADCADPGVPYTILAGNTALIPPPDPTSANKLQTLLQKLGRSAIEFPFLGQPNDIAVTVHSIKNVPKARSHPPQIQEVPCNHLVYFTDPNGLQSLAEAVLHTGILSFGNPLTDSDTPNLTTTPASNSRQMPSNALAEDKIPIGLIALIVVIAIAGGGFWLWQNFKPQEPTPQNQNSGLVSTYAKLIS